MRIYEIAHVAHEVNRAYCFSLGDVSQVEWCLAPNWQQESAISGVKFHLENDATPEDSHNNWLKDKIADGWQYGEVKDPEKKEHPCMVSYHLLPAEQRTKDYLFKAVVDACKGGVEETYGDLQNRSVTSLAESDSDGFWKMERYLQMLCEIQK